MCDTSGARVGERGVLFLSRAAIDSELHITHFGRGRLPVGEINGAKVAFLYEVRVPASIVIQREAAYPKREGVSLSALKALVKNQASKSAG